MHIYKSKIGDSFYFDGCVWTITGEIEEETIEGNIKIIFRECYNHDTRKFYSLHTGQFNQFKPTEWSL